MRMEKVIGKYGTDQGNQTHLAVMVMAMVLGVGWRWHQSSVNVMGLAAMRGGWKCIHLKEW